MRNIFVAFLIVFASCSNNAHKELEIPGSDSSVARTLGGQDDLKKIMDSILKAAGPNAQISIEGANDIKISEAEIKNLSASSLKTINASMMDSLIKRSAAKYTWVHFWATWCGPCRKEFPDLIKDVSGLRQTDVILVSSDYDTEEQRKKVLAVYNKLNTSLPVYINQIAEKTDGMGTEAQKALILHYGLNSDGGLPFNILIENKSRKILCFSSSYRDLFKDAK